MVGLNRSWFQIGKVCVSEVVVKMPELHEISRFREDSSLGALVFGAPEDASSLVGHQHLA